MKIRKKANWERVAYNLRHEMKKYISKAGLKALIIGESGGIDSALVTVLVRPVCDELNIPLIGRSISIETNTPEEQKRAHDIGVEFCHNFKDIDLTELFRTTVASVEEPDENEDKNSVAYKLRIGNIKARLRMIYLYNLSQQHKGMVLSTDNLTEFMLGFWTLHGDVGDYNPMYGLWKTEVYQLADYLVSTLTDPNQNAALQACIKCTPTDGLGITSSDVEQLGATNYDEVDNALTAYLIEGKNEINERVISRHNASAFKRLNPTIISRKEAFNGAE